eukprot:3794864-Rhodomonas_salina.2
MQADRPDIVDYLFRNGASYNQYAFTIKEADGDAGEKAVGTSGDDEDGAVRKKWIELFKVSRILSDVWPGRPKSLAEFKYKLKHEEEELLKSFEKVSNTAGDLAGPAARPDTPAPIFSA